MRDAGGEGGRPGSVFRGAFIDSAAELGEKVSQTGLCGIFVVFLGPVESPQSRDDGPLNARDLLKARNRDLSHANDAKCATPACGGIFHSLEKREHRVVEVIALAVEFCPSLKRFVGRTRGPVQNSLSRGVLYNVAASEMLV